MKSLFLIETFMLNGVHQVPISSACVYSESLAHKIKNEVDKANEDCGIETFTEVREIVLYQSEYEVPILNQNPPGVLPIINSKEKAKELQERLVQACIDYIKETNDDDIQEVEFIADSLQESAKHGHWQPATDSSIVLKTYSVDDNGIECTEILDSYN